MKFEENKIREILIKVRIDKVIEYLSWENI